jgi:hypothetical protein
LARGGRPDRRGYPLCVLKLHIEPRGRFEIIDGIILDDKHADLKRYREILGQAPPNAEIEQQEQPSGLTGDRIAVFTRMSALE